MPAAAQLHGDEDALFRLHNRSLVRVVRSLVCAADEDVHDACAFAWMQFLRRQPDREMAFNWLVKVATREAWRLARRDRRDARLEDLAVDSCAALGRDTLDDAMAARDALELLASLPDRPRRYLALQVSGHSYDDICAATGATFTNVNKNLCRARSRIRTERVTAQ
jgi:DNA-directed RNA polymerase specialized sigma24 family protein